MNPIETIVRFARTKPARRALLVEAGWNLALARAAVRWRPFRDAIGFGAIALGPRRDIESGAVVAAVEAAAARVPWRSVCFDQGLAVQRALRRRGRNARLYYGLSPPGEGPLEAHVWIVLEGQIIIGGEQSGGHKPVAVFPAD